MTIFFAYDGSELAGTAIAAAGALFGHDDADAVILTVWEPLIVEALRAVRFGGWLPLPLDVSDVDERDEMQAQQLAAHGAQLATEAGFKARAMWIADERQIADTIVEEADALDVNVIVMGTRGLTGISGLFGSVSRHVVQHAGRPVLVVPPPKEGKARAPGEKGCVAVS